MARPPTLSEAIVATADAWPDNGFTFQDLQGKPSFYPFGRVRDAVDHRAAALQDLGLGKGDRVGLIIVEPEDFVLTFLAAVRVGIVPVPLYPPLSLGSLDAYAGRTARILASAGAKILVASERVQNLLWNLVDRVPSLEKLVVAERLAGEGGVPKIPAISPEDLVFLQYTSGSTSEPKGVMVTHASLHANTYAIVHDGLKLDTRTARAVGWLPLYHDMGLIGFVIAPTFFGLDTTFIPTLRFLKRPNSWLQTMHDVRGTMSFAPNFAYSLAARKATEKQLADWDLSCIEILGCGAEPIHPETIRTFTRTFHERCGLPEKRGAPGLRHGRGHAGHQPQAHRPAAAHPPGRRRRLPGPGSRWSSPRARTPSSWST